MSTHLGVFRLNYSMVPWSPGRRLRQ